MKKGENMNFVSERIEGEDDIEYFNLFGFKDSNGNKIKPFWWAIDRDSDIFLFSYDNGVLCMPQKFGLCIDKELVELEALNKSEKKQLNSGLVLHWIINKIDIPIDLMEKGYVEDDIVYIMENAFAEFGLPGVGKKEIMDISVEIIASPMIVKKGGKSAESKDYIEGMTQSYKGEKKQKGNPFGCCFIIVIVLAYIIAEVISSQNNIEYSDGMLLRKLYVAIAVSIYGIIYHIKNLKK